MKLYRLFMPTGLVIVGCAIMLAVSNANHIPRWMPLAPAVSGGVIIGLAIADFIEEQLRRERK